MKKFLTTKNNSPIIGEQRAVLNKTGREIPRELFGGIFTMKIVEASPKGFFHSLIFKLLKNNVCSLPPKKNKYPLDKVDKNKNKRKLSISIILQRTSLVKTVFERTYRKLIGKRLITDQEAQLITTLVA